MNAGSQVEKLVVGETISLQRFHSLVPIDGINLTDRFQIIRCSLNFLVVKQTRGEQRGRTLMFARHLIFDVEPLGDADDREWRISLREPYTATEPPSGWELHFGAES